MLVCLFIDKGIDAFYYGEITYQGKVTQINCKLFDCERYYNK